MGLIAQIFSFFVGVFAVMIWAVIGTFPIWVLLSVVYIIFSFLVRKRIQSKVILKIDLIFWLVAFLFLLTTMIIVATKKRPMQERIRNAAKYLENVE